MKSTWPALTVVLPRHGPCTCLISVDVIVITVLTGKRFICLDGILRDEDGLTDERMVRGELIYGIWYMVVFVISQSKHICIAPYVANESEAHNVTDVLYTV